MLGLRKKNLSQPGIKFAPRLDLYHEVSVLNTNKKYKLDLRGTITSYSMLKVSQMFKRIGNGETLEILWSVSDSTVDLFKVLPPSSYELVSLEENNETDPFCRLKLKKRPVE